MEEQELEGDAGDCCSDVGSHKAWVEESDDETCARLYRNSITGEIRWDPPAEFTPRDDARLTSRARKPPRLTGPPPLVLAPLDNAGIAVHADLSGICLHTLHAKSTSGKEADLDAMRVIAPCDVPEAEVSGLHFTRLSVYSAYADQFPRTRRTAKLARPLQR